MTLDKLPNDIINNAPRAQLQDLLEVYGFAICDDEPTQDLRKAVRAMLDDKTIDPQIAYDHLHALPRPRFRS